MSKVWKAVVDAEGNQSEETPIPPKMIMLNRRARSGENGMGINLRDVVSIEWSRQDDRQLIFVRIDFKHQGIPKEYGDTMSDLLDYANLEDTCPLPLCTIPNYMGINLCSVDTILWGLVEEPGREQLAYVRINFIPEN